MVVLKPRVSVKLIHLKVKPAKLGNVDHPTYVGKKFTKLKPRS